jgi:hypothetical protein
MFHVFMFQSSPFIQASIDAWEDPWAAEADNPAYFGQFESRREVALPVLNA